MQNRLIFRLILITTLLINALFFSFKALAKEQIFQLSTHILDVSKGLPAKNVKVKLFSQDIKTHDWNLLAESRTDENGRISNFLPNKDNNGIYKLQFLTDSYFTSQGLTSIYPYIEVLFKINDNSHYHIPITVSDNGYSTYRGS